MSTIDPSLRRSCSRQSRPRHIGREERRGAPSVRQALEFVRLTVAAPSRFPAGMRACAHRDRHLRQIAENQHVRHRRPRDICDNEGPSADPIPAARTPSQKTPLKCPQIRVAKRRTKPDCEGVEMVQHEQHAPCLHTARGSLKNRLSRGYDGGRHARGHRRHPAHPRDRASNRPVILRARGRSSS